MNKNKVVVILGPTASGKTKLSVRLAKKFDGEIISADSRQVYRKMDIGTAKVTKKEMQGIHHHLLDVVSPKKRFSVVQYQKLAYRAINKILKKPTVNTQEKNLFLVGGSAFYIYSIVNGWVFPKIKTNQKLRNKLEKKSIKELFIILKKLTPKRAKTIERKNKRRLIRAIEIAKTLKQVPPLQKNPRYDCLLLGIKKSSKELKKLIHARLKKRFTQGMIKEVKNLKKQGLSWKKLDDFGLEYRWIARYLQGKINYQQMFENLQKDSEKFIKHQMTWFKRDKRIHWIKTQKQAETLISKFLH